MKNIFISTLFVASIGAAPALASDFNSGAVVSSEAAQNMQLCLEADMQEATRKAITACTKAYKSAIPNYAVRSDILTQRGWLQLSAGEYERAARDFKSASKLNSVNEYAYLGDGFVAMMQQDYETAIAYFNDCKTHDKAAPLAYYGLGMAKVLAGDEAGAYAAYQQAAKLLPEWQAPREELAHFKA